MSWKDERRVLISFLILLGLVSIIPSVLIFNAYFLIVFLSVAYFSLGSLIIEIFFSSEKQSHGKMNIRRLKDVNSES